MKLLVADDHTLFRDALLQYIARAHPEASVAVSGDYEGARAILQKDEDFDLVMLDLKMPGMRGLNGLREMIEEFPDTPVALMSGVAEREDVERAMEMGAAGYFPKTLSGKSLLTAVQHVLTGERFMPIEKETGKVMPSYYADIQPVSNLNGAPDAATVQDILSQFTPRERDVLEFLTRGATNKEIANALGVQVVTVKLHVRGICRKLGAKNRTQAAVKAQEIGLCELI